MAKLAPNVALERCAADLGHSPSRPDYVKWRHRLDRPRSVLSAQRIALGRSWDEALDDAGLVRRRRWGHTTAQVWIEVVNARRALGSPSVDDYNRWRRRTKPTPISATTMTVRTGRRWSELFPGD